MPSILQVFTYNHPWNAVTQAVFNKYPNPFAKHVLSSDVISRSVCPNTGELKTTRLFLKRGLLPAWGRALFDVSDVYVLEVSTVDPKTREMKVVTRNMSHKKLLLVEETQIIKPDSANGTIVDASARIISNTWYSLRSSVELFGVTKAPKNMLRSYKGLSYILDNLNKEDVKM